MSGGRLLLGPLPKGGEVWEVQPNDDSSPLSDGIGYY